MDSPVRALAVYADPARASDVAAALEDADERLRVDTADGYGAAVGAVDDSYDCVVAGSEFSDGDGLELLDTLRRERPGLSFVFYPERGSDVSATEALSAGVTDYVEAGSERYAVIANRVVNAASAERGDRRVTAGRDRLEEILSTVPSCVVQLDLDGNFIYANDRAEQVLGLSRDDLSDRSYNDPEWEVRDLDGEPIPDEELPFRRVVDTESPIQNARHTITWPDGSERVLSVSGAPLFEDGDLDGVVFSVTDVTDQHRREQRLAELHAATRDLYGAKNRAEVARITSEAAVSVLGFDLNGVHLYDESAGGLAPTAVSDDARESTEELATFDHGIAWEAYQDGEVRAYGDIREADEVFDPETNVRSGLYFPLGEHGILIASSDTIDDFDDTDLSLGRVLAANATAALDRVEREQALASLQRETNALMNTSTVSETAALAVTAAEETLGADLSGFLARDEDETALVPLSLTERIADSYDFPAEFAPDDGPVSRFLWEVVEGDGPVAVRDLEADGRFPGESPVRSVLAYPVHDGVFVFAADEPDAFDETDKRFCAILVAALDAALERVEREAVLRERTERLAEQNERLDQFASVVAHDLRNPLQVLRGVLDATKGDHVERGANALDRMETIIDDVLTLARDGTSIDATEAVSLDAIARSSWSTVDADTATLTVEGDRPLIADPDRLRQLLENLFRNAVEHGSADVTVRVGPLADGFYVADDGPGVPEDDRDQIFESGYSTTESGTGFGLAIVARIAEAHGWSIVATESADGGLRFEFTGVERPE